MKRVLAHLIGIDVLVYLGSILMFILDAASLVDTIRKVLQLLISSGLKCKQSECALFTEREHYLGHIVTAQRHRTSSDKNKESLSGTVKMRARILSHLCDCNYYRTLVPRFADLSVLLYAALRQSTIQWSINSFKLSKKSK